MVIFYANVEAWHPLPGAPLRFRMRFVAILRLRLGAGSGLSSAVLFGRFGSSLVGLVRCASQPYQSNAGSPLKAHHQDVALSLVSEDLFTSAGEFEGHDTWFSW